VLERLFHLSDHKTTVSREILAGVSTFMAIAYILAVNPAILGEVMDKGAVFTATVLASVGATLIAGLYANYPLALAPGMGLNAFFAYGICLGELGGQPGAFRVALTAVLVEGIIFVIMGFFKVRSSIANSMPHNLQIGVSAGIGLFIALIGMESGGVIVANPATLISLGSFRNPAMVLCMIGVLIIIVLMHKKVNGAIIIGMLSVWILGMLCQAVGLYVVDPAAGRFSMIPSLGGVSFLPPSIAPTFMQFDFAWAMENLPKFIVIMLSLLFVDLFDTIGTLLGMVKICKFPENEKGEIIGMERALTSDAFGTVMGACLGTSTITSVVESGVGASVGGRTGLTAVSTAAMFLIALFFAPVFLAIPACATAPAAIVVGFLMFTNLRNIDFADENLPSVFGAYMATVMMPFTYSIAMGIMFGILGWVGVSLLTGEGKKIPGIAYGLSVVFLVYIVFTALK